MLEPTRWLSEGDTVTIGDLTLDVYETPGHTRGHVIFHHAPSKFALVGDVLFQGSVGRSDLPGGDLDTLIRSIVEKLWPLGNDTAFIPGTASPAPSGMSGRAMRSWRIGFWVWGEVGALASTSPSLNGI